MTISSALSLTEQWNQRENDFAAFVNGPLAEFWQTRHEWRFDGVNCVAIQCVGFTAREHRRAIVLVSGFMDSYLKYSELIYDLFFSGYDVFMYDHRGQGLSGRILDNVDKVYVEQFDYYVDDLDTFWQQNIIPRGYQQLYLLGHSMGGAITALFLARHPQAVNAVALSAPMMGINLPMPRWCAKAITKLFEYWPVLSQAYALWRNKPFPFAANMLTHSKVRYQAFIDLYNQQAAIRLKGPTFHWVHEGLAAEERILAEVGKYCLPILLLQAGKEILVSNRAQAAFYQGINQFGHCNQRHEFRQFKEAHHELLFEIDEIRSQVLQEILSFFERYQ